jgi:hypothetical protein
VPSRRPPSRAASVEELLALGISRGALQGTRWAKPYRGVRVPVDRQVPAGLARIEATLPLLPPDGALGGWAAAHLLGLPYVDGVSEDGVELPVDHVVPHARRLRPRPGIRHRREGLDPTEIEVYRGVRLTASSRTAVDTARWAPGLVAAVVALDSLLHARYVTGVNLGTQLQRMRGRPGISQAREALRLSDARAESPGETRLRLVWTQEAGLPPLLVNPRILRADGLFLARVDLLDEEAGLVLEYDGAHHRELRQHSADNLREERLERAGLRVLRFTSVDMRDREGAVQRMLVERASRLGRDRSGESWRVRR